MAPVIEGAWSALEQLFHFRFTAAPKEGGIIAPNDL
jgi:hypothetical protein